MTLSVDTGRGPRVLYAPRRISGAFFLRPNGSLAGFSLRLPLPSRVARTPVPVLRWESTSLETGPTAALRLGRQEVQTAVSVLCAEIPGDPAYVKVVLEGTFCSWGLRLPALAWRRPRRVRLRLFTEIRVAHAA
ncbi:hypothetical protein ACFQYP_14940 [Nonomuraea antimicrobica]